VIIGVGLETFGDTADVAFAFYVSCLYSCGLEIAKANGGEDP